MRNLSLVIFIFLSSHLCKAQFIGLDRAEANNFFSVKGIELEHTLHEAKCNVKDYASFELLFNSSNKCYAFLMFPASVKTANEIIEHLNQNMVSEEKGKWRTVQNGYLTEYKLYYVEGGNIMISATQKQ